MTHDVLDHNDGVVDEETGRDGERHEGEVIEAESRQIHDAERTDDRKRDGDAWDNRCPEAAKEQKNREHDKPDSEQQRELDIGDACADGLRAITQDRQLDFWQ